jgi:hypothetical protein
MRARVRNDEGPALITPGFLGAFEALLPELAKPQPF